MFIEFITKRNEKVTININMILFITAYKDGITIIDCDGNNYESFESYDSFITRLQDKIN